MAVVNHESRLQSLVCLNVKCRELQKLSCEKLGSNIQIFQKYCSIGNNLELVSKELNHFGVIADSFLPIWGF